MEARLYNFLDSRLLPKITTNAQCTDDHEVSNLISDNFLVRSRGFVADTSTRPPVHVDVELLCPINVHYIILAKNLNHQYFTTVELLAKYKTTFSSIAYERFDTTGIIFCNSTLYNSQKLPVNIDTSYRVAFFKPHARRSFSTVSFLKVNFVRVERSVPCLGRLEVWGNFSHVCPDETIKTVDRLMGLTPVQSTQVVQNGNPGDEFEIPDDFKDALTFEVMSLPVTLPSGNTVDQTTLDKWVETEAAYGRSGSDPFTAQRFNDVRKPIFNAALKHRIDMFLLQNAHRKETFGIQRTVGKSNGGGKKRKILEDSRSETSVDLSSEDSLSSAIKRTVGSTRFISFTSDECAVSDTKMCVKCNVPSNLYAIPCEHFYCKNCLLSVCDVLKCMRCNAPFLKSDSKRVH
ncbi:hypothetical protein PPYR_11546 [Photinus pyralis]|uniref:U-box domain-containing protein n=1 Tax=Photinus pyralis TaxID=7054 RepID=A0A1Y1MH15_PHOPY|nr:RING finger protein 37 [Photinus pyralis]KAB0794707.1 hypothetical protein PPYR_11546 [Photinus pyralis]